MRRPSSRRQRGVDVNAVRHRPRQRLRHKHHRPRARRHHDHHDHHDEHLNVHRRHRPPLSRPPPRRATGTPSTPPTPARPPPRSMRTSSPRRTGWGAGRSSGRRRHDQSGGSSGPSATSHGVSSSRTSPRRTPSPQRPPRPGNQIGFNIDLTDTGRQMQRAAAEFCLFFTSSPANDKEPRLVRHRGREGQVDQFPW